ncbi:Tigger transposable element-derived protein 1-like 175 [Homarus americanus]|uniref:Tigger transposable element-derived protein 1-like 175 n=1 Tax=Homarus americanus TaxID=6706 RepID=A0A8J5JKN5_HOMAM|nr:Tigger transposable element-derived protein 1-like 175 [Homarus americanus]
MEGSHAKLHECSVEESVAECVHDFSDFTDIIAIHPDIASISQEAGLQDVDEDNVAEVLDSHSEKLSTEDLLLLEQQQRGESTGEEENPAPMMLTMKVLSTSIGHLNTAMELLAENDPNINRSLSVRAVVEDMLCYKEVYSESINTCPEVHTQYNTCNQPRHYHKSVFGNVYSSKLNA